MIRYSISDISNIYDTSDEAYSQDDGGTHFDWLIMRIQFWFLIRRMKYFELD